MTDVAAAKPMETRCGVASPTTEGRFCGREFGHENNSGSAAFSDKLAEKHMAYEDGLVVQIWTGQS